MGGPRLSPKPPAAPDLGAALPGLRLTALAAGWAAALVVALLLAAGMPAKADTIGALDKVAGEEKPKDTDKGKDKNAVPPETPGAKDAAAAKRPASACPPIMMSKAAAQRWPEACGTGRPPKFDDPAIDPMIALEGVWDVTLEKAPIMSGAVVVLNKGHVGSYFRQPGAEWSAARVARNRDGSWNTLLGSGRALVTPQDGVQVNLGGYGFSSRPFVVQVRPTGSPDVLAGRWTYDGRKGRSIWRRRPPITIRTVAFNSRLKDARGNWVVDRVAYGTRPGRVVRDHELTCGYGHMRGNCPGFTIVVYGANFAGPHHVWIDPASHMEIVRRAWACANGKSYDYGGEWHRCGLGERAGDTVVGLVLSVLFWDGVSPGPRTVWVDGRPVPFELVIRGYPEEKKPPRPKLVSLRALASGGDAGGAPLERIAEGVPFVIEAAYDGDHPDEWVAVELPGLRPPVIIGGRLGSEGGGAGGSAAGVERPPRSVVLRRTADKTVFRSAPLAVEAAARRSP